MVLEESRKVSKRLEPRWRIVRHWMGRTAVVGGSCLLHVFYVGLLTMLSVG